MDYPWAFNWAFQAPGKEGTSRLATSLHCLQNTRINANTSYKETSWRISCKKESGLNFWAHKLCHHSSKVSLYLYMAANTARKQQYLLLQTRPVWPSKWTLLLLPPKTLTLPALWPFRFGAPPKGQQLLLRTHVSPRDIRWRHKIVGFVWFFVYLQWCKSKLK